MMETGQEGSGDGLSYNCVTSIKTKDLASASSSPSLASPLFHQRSLTVLRPVMLAIITTFAMAGLAFAGLGPREMMHQIRTQPPLMYSPDDFRRDVNPCKILSEAFHASDIGGVHVPPSLATACLKSVPLDKERDLALLDYLLPFIKFQSTLEILADPPEEYLFPGVDVLGGFDVMREKLQKNEYAVQYDFMSDLRSIVSLVEYQDLWQ